MRNNIQNGWQRAITKILTITLTICILLVCLPVIASAFNVDSKITCAPTLEVRDALVGNDEQIVVTGFVTAEVFMTLWTNKTGDWTIVITNKSSKETSCVVLHGVGLRALKEKIYI